MPRVTDAEVKTIIETDLDTSVAFIPAASLLVDEELAHKGLSAARLKQIELWLAAHFTSIHEERGGLAGEKVGEASQFYGTKFGPGLKGTRYGQQALVFDSTGTLASLADGQRKSVLRLV